MFTSRYRSVPNREGRSGEAIIVSFFTGNEYYARCATRLARQCEQYGLAHDICEYIPTSTEHWINICRRKVAFYTSKSDEYDSAVMWLDVDSQIIADPRQITRSTADLGAFLRNFRYLVDFDPMLYARLLHPGYLLFNRTERTRDFMQTLRDIDRDGEPSGTDDFVLQEALLRYAGQLSIELFSPVAIVSSNQSENRGEAVFQHGDSGNVRPNVAVAFQHQSGIMTKDRRKQVFLEAADHKLRQRKYRDAAAFLRHASTISPDDKEIVARLLKAYHALGWKTKYRKLLDSVATKPELRSAAIRHQYQVAHYEANFAQASRITAEIERCGSDEDIALVQSRQYRLSFDEEAARRKIEDESRVKLWWWERPFPGNLGDMINPYLIEKLTGTPPKYWTKSGKMLAIGSIIRFAKKGDGVWGTGCPSMDQVIEPEAIFHAVRGPLTRRMVLDAGGVCEPIYGDPAWLLPLVYPSRKDAKTHRVGLIRHFTHRNREIRLGYDVREIEIIRNGRKGIEEFLDEVLACEAIVSTSLHGVIIANAYGIPVKLATFVDSCRQIHGDGMKFEDYFLSIGRNNVKATDLNQIDRLEGSFSSQCTDNPEKGIDLQALLSAAPFKIDRSIQLALRYGGLRTLGDNLLSRGLSLLGRANTSR